MSRRSAAEPHDEAQAADTCVVSDGHLRRHLRIALLHAAPRRGDLDGNRELIEHGTRIAAAAGADWVLSGELVVTGYRFSSLTWTDWIVPEPAAWLRRLQLLSAELGTAMFVSHPERDAHTIASTTQCSPSTGPGASSVATASCDQRRAPRTGRLPTTTSRRSTSMGAGSGMLSARTWTPPSRHGDFAVDGAQLIMSAATWWPGEWGPSGEWEAHCARPDYRSSLPTARE